MGVPNKEVWQQINDALGQSWAKNKLLDACKAANVWTEGMWNAGVIPALVYNTSRHALLCSNAVFVACRQTWPEGPGRRQRERHGHQLADERLAVIRRGGARGV